jgi:hypothetical protein
MGNERLREFLAIFDISAIAGSDLMQFSQACDFGLV